MSISQADLIETYWDVKTLFMIECCECSGDLIETYWDVKISYNAIECKDAIDLIETYWDVKLTITILSIILLRFNRNILGCKERRRSVKCT